MKRTLFASLFFAIVAPAFSAGMLDQFYNIPFGASVDEVKKSVESRNEGVRAKSDPNGVLRFQGISYGGRKTQFMAFEFAGGKMARVTVLFQPIEASPALEHYKSLKTAIAGKYGREVSSEKSGYSDRRVLEGLWREKEPIATTWKSPTASLVLSLTGRGKAAAVVSIQARDHKLSYELGVQPDKGAHGKQPGKIEL